MKKGCWPGLNLISHRFEFGFVCIAAVSLVLLALCAAEAQTSQPGKSASSQKAKASAKPGQKTAAKPPRPAAKGSANAHLKVYRSGHGNHGFGTTKAPPRYTAPLPATVPTPVQPSVSGAAAIDFRDQLSPFFAHLQTLARDHTADNAQTVRILQFGDSHTAADMFTGRMRSLFQQRFGNGGAGFTYAGHPFAGYRILGTGRSQSPGWSAEGVHFTHISDTELGLGGVANTATRVGESLELDATCSRFEMHYLDQPGGGTFSLLEDGEQMVELSTDSNLKATPGTDAETLSETCTPGMTHHFEVRTSSNRPVRLLGFVTEQPGITYEALGLNGAEASLMLRWNQPIFKEYLRQRNPSLIVLAYGTNEAGNHNWTYESYRDLLGRIVDMLHATLPGVSVLVIGPPDRSVRAGRRGRNWTTYTQTMRITDAQRDACQAHGCAFWSWRDRMGGLGSMNRWVANGLAQPDHVHFTSSGYVQLADLFYSDMIAAYAVWKTAQATPAQ